MVTAGAWKGAIDQIISPDEWVPRWTRELPLLLTRGDWDQVWDIAWNLSMLLVARARHAQELKETGFEPLALFGPFPGTGPGWIDVERHMGTLGFLPCAIRLGSLVLDAPDQAADAVAHFLAMSRGWETRAADPQFQRIAQALWPLAIPRERGLADLDRLSETIPAEGYESLWAMGYVFASLQQEITAEAAAVNLLTVAPYLADRFPPELPAYGLILLPFLESFWTKMFENQRFRFQTPRLVESALRDALQTDSRDRMRAIFRAVVLGFGSRLNPSIRAWLDNSSTETAPQDPA